MSRNLLCTLTALVALAVPTEGSVRSFQGSLVQNDVVEVSAENQGIRVVNYRFTRPLRSAKKLFKKDGGPTMDLVVTNEGKEPQDFSVAVALFDLKGKLVGVASEKPSGKIKPGETKEVSLTFKHLNRFTKNARTFTLSLELKL